MKNTVFERKNIRGRINIILDTTEENTSELEDIAVGTIQMKQKKRLKKDEYMWAVGQYQAFWAVIRVSEGRVKCKWYQKKSLKKIMVDFPNLET